jgi:hypothetical protein
LRPRCRILYLTWGRVSPPASRSPQENHSRFQRRQSVF